jgi:hypothetical protein
VNNLALTLLAPEQVDAWRFNLSRELTSFNYLKCDVFALGLVLLSCATFANPLNFYDQEKKQILMNEIENSLAVLSTSFSPMLVSLIAQMLSGRDV